MKWSGSHGGRFLVGGGLAFCYSDYVTGVARGEQSGAGRWSFWLSLLGGSVFLCSLALLSLSDRWEAAVLPTVSALGILGGLLLTVAALALGVAGILQRRRRRLFALLGTAISFVVLLVASYGFS